MSDPGVASGPPAKSFLEECRALIALDSTPSHGNLTSAEYAGRLCEQAGLHVDYQRESMEGIDQCNIIARPQASVPEKEILFQTHLDTVEAAHFSQWTKTQSNPFNASIYSDLIYGLGTADVKLDFLCKLEAAKEFARKPMRTPFVLVGTFGAQTGMNGAIKLMRRKKINATRAFIGEPTNNKLVIAGQGLAVLEISIPFSDQERDYRRDHDLLESATTQSKIFAGKAAHSSDPSSGDNAIMKMLAYLAQMPEGIAIMDADGGINYNSVPGNSVLEIDTAAVLKDPILPKLTKMYASFVALAEELKAHTDTGFYPPHPTLNVGIIRTFDTDIRLTGSCRLPPSVHDRTYEAWMKKLESAVQSVGATFRVKDYRKGFTTEESLPFVLESQDTLKSMGLEAGLEKITMVSEASVFSRLGVECLVWGPGQSVGNSHAPNEHVSVSDLKQATEFYKRLMERFCT